MTVRNCTAVALWGGFGSRQRMMTRRDANLKSPIRHPAFINTNAIPKPLVPLATVPVSQINLENIRAVGIEDVYATTHVQHPAIQQYFFEGAGAQLGVDGLWFEKNPMGTAPGLAMNILLRASLRERAIYVPSGDIVTDMNIEELITLHQNYDSLFTIGLNPVYGEILMRLGTATFVQLEGPFGRVTGFKEKAPTPGEALVSQVNGTSYNLNNSSEYVIDPRVFVIEMDIYDSQGIKTGRSTLLEKIFPNIDRDLLKQIVSGQIDVASQEEAETYFPLFGQHDPNFNDFGKHILPQLAANGLLHGYYFNDYWNDIGDNETYWFANWHALNGQFKINIPFPEISPGVWVDPSATIIEGAKLIPPVVIGKGVHIEQEAIVGPYAIIDQGWALDSGVEFAYSITWRHWPLNQSIYPDGTCRILEGVHIEKSILAGVAPVGDHLHKVVIGDGFAVISPRRVRSVVGLKIRPDSEGRVQDKAHINYI